jgi:tripartite-type tricarboxylate transporter receptor subunit TctC
LTAASRLQAQTEPDGTTFTLLQSNNLYIPLIKEGQVPFDPREVDWLGSLSRERHVLVTWHTSGLKTFEDVLNATEPVIIGATTLNQINGTLPEVMRQALPDVPIEIVTGYEGTGEILLAMQRGEVMARSQSITSLFTGSEKKYVETGELIPLVQLTPSGSPKLEGLPLITEFVSPEMSEKVFDFVFLPVAASRPFAVPKGVPEDRLAAMRAAFEAAAADPEYLEAMERIDTETELLTGQEVADIIDRIYATPEETLATFREFLN